jgi:tetratricopeptide (TPR) repeat protein
VKQLSASNATLQVDKQDLQNQLAVLHAGPDAAALATENAVLKKELAELKARNATPASPAADDSAVKLQEAQAQLAVIQSEKEVLKQQKESLENRVKELSAVPVAAATSPAPSVVATNAAPAMDTATATRIAQLEAERAELKKTLEDATWDVTGTKKGKALAARMDELTHEVAALRAHIVVLESSNVPYTPDELALLSKPANVLIGASAHHPKKEHRPFTPAQLSLVKEGQELFVEKKYDEAEQKYQAVLAMDPTNIVTLADLASVQLEAGHLPQAEQNLKHALAIDPDDDYSLYVLGQVKFQEKDYDASLNALSRAAEIMPLNANIRNFIGLALDEKGLRREAETAFRRAIQLDPEFAEAHMNLAVVYATQKPPLLQLAKWHYQKAMTIGHAPNRALEKMLDDISNPASAAPH